MMAESVEVPFIIMGNRRCLTAEQLQDDPSLASLASFVTRFRGSFEFRSNMHVYVFIEPDDGIKLSSSDGGSPSERNNISQDSV